MTTVEEDFFSEAYRAMYNWLSEDEKVQFSLELINDEGQIHDDSNSEFRFFRLLNFIEIKYIRLEKYVKTIYEEIENVSNNNSDYIIKDIIIKDENDADFLLSTLGNYINEINPESLFKKLLINLEIEKNYIKYLEIIKGRDDDKWLQEDDYKL